MTELKVLAVVKPQTDMTAATPLPTTFVALVQALNIIPGQSQMLQFTFQLVSSPMGIGSDKPQADNHIVTLMPDADSNSALMEIAKPVRPLSLYLCR